ncbi:LIM-type zinc finger-containing protein [Heterostelium album PN500]|uniref:LIM-type zinc finger-containing protein n=1 Tax=Heterostelium pallidum (strain ATCC 26659 / Pp 5 / PN500) TaxID=670386 RepID=D3B006_HETP5|nr:LIM-type zinc finger-containing protein [Heterostelium album PN500]EFA84630.1 LIM-type zinc finger-containing protein [Heterostelium album PN500]|eukprot:XP_020436743.1 LIM-type zinc finger-containing protein [Heterostelium album PN500]
MSETIKGNWTSSSAYNLDLALKESREWIEAVIQQKFPSDDFQASLKNGLFLCKLINQIKPGIVPKTNPATTDFAYRENLSFFIKAAKQLGLRDTQLFESSDLYEAKRIRNVAISLYWLGRAARGISTYKGPQLNLLAFQKMNCSACKKAINDNNYLATLTQQYHTSCAVCCNCSCKLDPKQPFFMEGNNIWCQNCMVGATKIGSGSGAGSQASGGKAGHGHKHDNECTGCHGSLENGYVPDEKDESKKYCTKCICDLCHNPLIGNFNVVNGEKICDDCSCSGCSKPLKEGFFEEGLAKYCEGCNDQNNKKNQKPTLSPSTAKKDHDHGHGHHHHEHGPGCSHDNKPKPSTTTTSNNNNNNNKKGCKECNKPLDTKQKVGNDRDLFCSPHEKERCCGGCNREVEGQVLQAMDKSWHPDCFTCKKCSKDLKKPGETIRKGADGNPLCGPCSSGSGPSNNNCGSCNKPVVGQGVEALDKKWHPACFKCSDCKKTLGDEFFEVGNKALCDPCYNSQPSTGASEGYNPNDKCAGCTKQLGVGNEVTKINKHFWHRGCFKCDSCNAALQTGYFLHGDDRPHCKVCHDKIEASKSDKCPKCNKPILSGEIVKASGKMWHKACFSCFKCSKQIGDGSTFTRFSKPYCKPCWEQEKAK